jgi:hypothetical protein
MVRKPHDYVAAMEATRETRPAWYRSFILGEWGAFEGQAFPEFEDAIHVVKPFPIPEYWERFASHDHGLNHDTVFLAWAADEDGNVVVFGEYSAPGLVSKHAAAFLERNERWRTERIWSDPSVFHSQGLSTPRNWKASVATEYGEHGVYLGPANNDRQAGYARLLELLHVEPARLPPPWAQVRSGIDGAPRLLRLFLLPAGHPSVELGRSVVAGVRRSAKRYKSPADELRWAKETRSAGAKRQGNGLSTSHP